MNPAAQSRSQLPPTQSPIINSNILNPSRSTFLLAGLGSALEYYDFVIYGMLAKYLKLVFFSNQNENLALLQFFSVFALGYFARPLGGIISGLLGDKWGRKPAFLLVTALMAISTFMIGILPDYAKIGFMASLLLVTCRLMQGLSFGGELPAATTIIAEFSRENNKSFRVSFVIASASLGALFASLSLFLLTYFLSETEILAWGWRIPFILGGVLGILLLLARKNLSETPEFQSEQKLQKIGQPLKHLIQNKISLLLGLMLTVFMAAMVIGNLFYPYFLHQYYHFSESMIYLGTSLGLLSTVFMLPLCGRLADKFSKTGILKYTLLFYMVSSVFCFNLLNYENNFVLIGFLILHQFFTALFSAAYFPVLISLFPTAIRFTGIASAYNITYAFMGLLPTLLTFFLTHFQTPLIMPWVLTLAAIVSLIGVTIIANRNRSH